MSMSFNVLTDPWIPVRTRDGEIREMGILETLRLAPDCLEVTSSFPNWEFGIYRFLFAFLMDVFLPRTAAEIGRLYTQGSFDERTIQTYLEQCRAEGVSFDLFDASRPFLQEPLSSWERTKKTKIRHVLRLTPDLTAANNPAHYEKRFEDEITLSLPDAARSLCSLSPFTHAEVKGYPSSVNGQTIPVYSIVRGENLFHTLVAGMVPVPAGEETFSHPYWRWGEKLTAGDLPAVSLLFGLTLPARRVTLLDHTNPQVMQVMREMEQPAVGAEAIPENRVGLMLWAPGLGLQRQDNWWDPYVAYLKAKEGSRLRLIPRPGRGLWRDLDAICDPFRRGVPLVVKQYSSLLEADTVGVNLYSLANQRSKLLEMSRNTFRLPGTLLRSRVRMTAMKEGLVCVDIAGRQLQQKIAALRDELRGESEHGADYLTVEAERAEKEFYTRCESLFFEWLLPELSELSHPCEETIGQWKTRVRSLGLQVYGHCLDRLRLNACGLMAAARAKMKAAPGWKPGKGGNMVAGSEEFFREVDALDERERILLRRSFGRLLQDCDARTMMVFYRVLPTEVKPWEQNRWLFAAGVHCLWEGEKAGEPLPVAAADYQYRNHGNAPGTFWHRLAVLMDTDWDDDEFLLLGMARMIRLLRNRGYVIDSNDLLASMLGWNADNRYVQRRWAEQFASTLRERAAEEEGRNAD